MVVSMSKVMRKQQSASAEGLSVMYIVHVRMLNFLLFWRVVRV